MVHQILCYGTCGVILQNIVFYGEILLFTNGFLSLTVIVDIDIKSGIKRFIYKYTNRLPLNYVKK